MDELPAPGPEAPAPVPTCFRHPDRETYLSCSRCGRPACPDCLRSAPVGQHCVECVHEGNRGVRQPTAVFGGRLPSGATVTWVLVGLNVLFYLVEWVYPRIVNYFDMIGAAYDPTIHQTVGVANDQWYRLLTSAFLHEPGLSGFGPAHIIFNMWALILVGPALERMLGRVRFLAVYLLSALGGSVLFYFFAAPAQPALGASGAIFGLFGAWFVLARRLRLDSRRDRVPDRPQPGHQLRGSVHRLAGSRWRARHGGPPHRGLRLRPAQAPNANPARCHGRDPGHPGHRHGHPDRPADLSGSYLHLVDRTTPPMMKAKPTTRFQSARAPIGSDPWVT